MSELGDSNLADDFDPTRLRQLAAEQCDETLSDDGCRELEAMLAKSLAARTMYVRYLQLQAGLDWQITSCESVAGLIPTEATFASRPIAEPGKRSRRHGSSLAIAAGLLVAVTAAALAAYLNSDDRGARQAAQSSQDQAAESPIAKIATVKQLGPDAQWAVTPHPDSTPMELRENDVVCVTEGQIEVTFDCGAVVTLYAPAIMEAISPMKGRAIRGRLAANVSDGAEGFTIETPRATVVDLGTVFGVEVGDKGATDVVVFKGAVDLHFDEEQRGDSVEGSLRLTSGEALRMHKGETPSRIVSIYSDKFSKPEDSDAQVTEPVLISAVTDNIDRQSGSWNYYEIVHGGMREDAKAFVDRVAHEWNGLEQDGMPPFLVGGDYVKTFNNDKYLLNLELFVTVDRPCRLYILVDDRTPPPVWLQKEFHDTGFDVGLDVGPFYRVEDGVLIDDRQPGVGPGVAVDNVFSVWERKVKKPQVVHLRSIEADHRYINMYGIVAVPLDRR